MSYQDALKRARDKQRHKEMWSTRTRETVEARMHFYQETDVYPFRQPYLKRHGGLHFYRHLVEHKKTPSILEYGCGSAIVTEYLMARYPECRYTVADIPSLTLEFVNWKKRTFNYPCDILTIGAGRAGIPLLHEYDLIICQDVLEHTPNPLDIVSSFIDHLSPCGVLIVDFMNAPGGENLPEAAEQRECVKKHLCGKLTPVKAIDERNGCDGLYVKLI
jgi:2-polyprenyl-3-methyl-5-hydroxy-6-metoxy-1,4-benzoquinol methylase